MCQKKQEGVRGGGDGRRGQLMASDGRHSSRFLPLCCVLQRTDIVTLTPLYNVVLRSWIKRSRWLWSGSWSRLETEQLLQDSRRPCFWAQPPWAPFVNVNPHTFPHRRTRLSCRASGSSGRGNGSTTKFSAFPHPRLASVHFRRDSICLLQKSRTQPRLWDRDLADPRRA